MLVVCHQVYFQFIVKLLCLLDFVIPSQPVTNSIHVLINQPEYPLRFAPRGLPMNLEDLLWNAKFRYPSCFLLFCER